MEPAARLDVVVLGSGSHATVVVDILTRLGEYRVLGCVWPDSRPGHQVLGLPMLGDRSLWPDLIERGVGAAIGIGGWTDNDDRTTLYTDAVAAGFEIVPVVNPSVVVGAGVEIGHGACVYPGVTLNTGVVVGANTIVVAGTTVDHETTLGDHVLVSTGVTIGGRVTVGDGAVVAIGATVASNVTIGAKALVAAGAVVVDDVPEGATVQGVPARVVDR